MRRVCISVFLISTTVLGLRMQQSCLDLNTNLFPLDVDGLLKSSNHNKKTYFGKLRDMGIDKSLSMTGDELSPSCLEKKGKPLKMFFVGDSTMHGLFTEFVERRGNTVSEEVQNEKYGFDFSKNNFNRMLTDGKADKPDIWKYGSGSTENIGGHHFIAWKGVGNIAATLKQKFDDFSETHTVVFMLGTAVHNVATKKKGNFPEWATDRENTLRTFLNKTQDALPDAVIIWDTPAFMDIPIMRAKPVGERFRKFPELMQQILRLSEIDEKVCKDMNIPMTARTKLGRAYRGLSSDGIHYESSYGSSGWNILYEMFFSEWSC